METYTRGFSNTFLPESKVEVVDLQYIEGGELERAWKTSRRQRLKAQEQKIWDDFVKEQDVVQLIVSEDKYQFLEDLPEPCLKEILETQLQKMKLEVAKEQKQIVEETSTEPPCAVAFTEERDGDMFLIYDDVLSEPEEEIMNESLDEPCTVREREDEGETIQCEQDDKLTTTSPADSPEKNPSKESLNVSNMIESSIYCAKVKELRNRLHEELCSIISWLESASLGADAAERRGLHRRAAEFCSRFQRIHLYQLQRQMDTIRRMTAQALPFAKHTQFQSQMVRIVSLHQNMLQSFQVLYKSFEQTACLRQSAVALKALVQATRNASTASRAVVAPADCSAASQLYDDELMVSCDGVDKAVKEYSARVADRPLANSGTPRSKKSTKGKGKKKTAPELETRLSMYSVETQRKGGAGAGAGGHAKQPGGAAGPAAAVSAGAGGAAGARGASARRCAGDAAPRSHRSRRPLMRDPHEGMPHPRRTRMRRDADIHTLVEAVGPPSSREASPRQSNNVTPRHLSNDQTPRNRNKEFTPRAATKDAHPRLTPRAVPFVPVSKASPRVNPSTKTSNLVSPRYKTWSPYVKPVMSVVTSETQDTCSQDRMSPVSKIHCATKDRSPRVDAYSFFKDIQGVARKDNVLSDDLAKCDAAAADDKKNSNGKNKASYPGPAGCDVTRLLRQLCGGDMSNERVSGSKNAQLLCVTGSNPQPPSTPQLLKILEETIKKKPPKSSLVQKPKVKDLSKLRLTFNIPEQTANNLFHYRTKFVQHMLSSSMYANSAVGKPWEIIGDVSEDIINELLTTCAKEMELGPIIEQLYKSETHAK